MDSIHDDSAHAEARRVSRRLQKAKTVFQMHWQTGSLGNSSGRERILEHEGRYYVMPDEAELPAAVFDDFESAFASDEAAIGRTLNSCMVTLDCDRWTAEELLDRMVVDPHVDPDSTPGQRVCVNGKYFAWNWDHQLGDPKDVAPISPWDAANAILGAKIPPLEVCEGLPSIHEHAGWFWIREDACSLVPRGYRSLADARAARGEAIELLTLEWRFPDLCFDEFVSEETLWFRWSGRTGELWRDRPDAGKRLLSRSFRCSAEQAGRALLDEHLQVMLCSPWSPGQPTCVRGAALSRDVGRRRIASVKAKVQRTRAKAEQQSATILDVARAAGLQPQPSGHSLQHWVARCPAHHLHTLLMSTEGEGSFGCGYCRKKGDARDLELWVRRLRKSKS